MGAALIEGLCARGGAPAGNVRFFDSDTGITASLAKRLGIRPFPGNRELAAESDLIVIAVKPFAVKTVLEEIREVLTPSKMLISIAAGVRTASMERFAGAGIPVVRAMPGLSAASGRGITVICAGKYALGEHMDKAEQLFSAAGAVISAEEKMMDAATAVGGSGPAYLFYFVEALESAAAAEGFGRDEAAMLARATVCGAASLLENSGAAPGELRQMVTTPGGTTEAAMKILENGFCELVLKAVSEARKRASEISRQISNPE